jgi:hypothetical protein
LVNYVCFLYQKKKVQVCFVFEWSNKWIFFWDNEDVELNTIFENRFIVYWIKIFEESARLRITRSHAIEIYKY